MGKNSSKVKLFFLGPPLPCPVLPRPARPSTARPGPAPQLLELFGVIPRLPDSNLWGHFLSNHSGCTETGNWSRSLQETRFTLTPPSRRWSPPSRSRPRKPVSPPSFEIYIVDVCLLPSSITTAKPLSRLVLAPYLCPPPLWSVSNVVAVRAVFLKAEAVTQCLRLPTALGIKSRFLKRPSWQPPLALRLCPSSPEPPYAAPLGPVVSLGRKL